MNGIWQNGRFILASTIEERLLRYEKMLFEMGAMNKPPCFKCGYNGPGYFQPEIHKCAEQHWKYFKGDRNE